MKYIINDLVKIMSNGTKSITIIVGNLGADPELKYMPGGDAVLNISVATTEKWKSKQSGESVLETEWHRCVLFRIQAENAAKYLTKGSKVWIQGRNRTRKWNDKNGNDRYTTEIIVKEIQYLDKAPSNDTENAVNDTPVTELPLNDAPEFSEDTPD